MQINDSVYCTVCRECCVKSLTGYITASTGQYVCSQDCRVKLNRRCTPSQAGVMPAPKETLNRQSFSDLSDGNDIRKLVNTPCCKCNKYFYVTEQEWTNFLLSNPIQGMTCFVCLMQEEIDKEVYKKPPYTVEELMTADTSTVFKDSLAIKGLIEQGMEHWKPKPAETSEANKVQVGGDHYKNKAIQPWDYILANKLGFLEGNIVKYVSRWRDKGGVDDLRKAQHYLKKLIEEEG